MAPGDEQAFLVRLAAVGQELELLRPGVDASLELVEGETAVELGIPAFEDVEVDPVQDGHAHGVTLLGDQRVESRADLVGWELDPRHRLAGRLEEDEARLAVARLLVARQRRPGCVAVD